VYCKPCQLAQNATTGTFACLHCKTAITRVVAKKINMYPEWKRVEEHRLIEEEKRKLPQSQPLVEWEREYRRQRAQLRFGGRMRISERPQFQDVQNVFFACPKEDCRGFINEHVDRCETCGLNVCKLCREVKSGDHVCNADALQSLALLRRDSRPCPKCTAMIFRIEGCNHMHCTWCNTHFDWHSGLVLSASSNGHYAHTIDLDRAAAVAQRRIERTPPECEEDHQAEEVLAVIRELPEGIVRRTLWTDYSVVHFALEKYYGTNVIGTKRDNTLMNLRIAYLMNEISETQWRTRVFSAHKSFELARAVAFQFGVYLEYISHYQRLYVQERAWNPEEISHVIRQTNEFLGALADEYAQSERIRIRTPFDSDDTPGLLR
jgi:hypothetical protein